MNIEIIGYILQEYYRYIPTIPPKLIDGIPMNCGDWWWNVGNYSRSQWKQLNALVDFDEDSIRSCNSHPFIRWSPSFICNFLNDILQYPMIHLDITSGILYPLGRSKGIFGSFGRLKRRDPSPSKFTPPTKHSFPQVRSISPFRVVQMRPLTRPVSPQADMDLCHYWIHFFWYHCHNLSYLL